MSGSGTAASSYYIYKTLVHEFRHHLCHAPGCLAIAARGVRQPRIGMTGHRIRTYAGKFCHPWFYIPRTERTVQPYGVYGSMAHRGDERFKGLSRECPPILSGYGHRKHHRHFTPCIPHHTDSRIKPCLKIQSVEYSLEKQQVHTTFNQPLYLFGIGIIQLIVSDRPHPRIIHVRTHRGCLVGGSDASRHHDLTSRGIRHLTRYPRTLTAYLTRQVLH